MSPILAQKSSGCKPWFIPSCVRPLWASTSNICLLACSLAAAIALVFCTQVWKPMPGSLASLAWLLEAAAPALQQPAPLALMCSSTCLLHPLLHLILFQAHQGLPS